MKNKTYEYTESYANEMDQQDPLKDFRNKFHMPNPTNHESPVYMNGNSLGAAPKIGKEMLDQEYEDWAKLGVEGHFHAENPWLPYHRAMSEPLSKIVGASVDEVVVMGTLTNNLNAALESFYIPNGKRKKIIMDGNEFPSDKYAIQEKVKRAGGNPETDIIYVNNEDEPYLSQQEISDTVKKHSGEVALVLLPGVNYYSGQALDPKKVVETVKAADSGALVGFDNAHAVGNIPTNLSDAEADFAVWCHYKYMNSGPGAIAGMFVNKKHNQNKNLPQQAGWWGVDEKTRFQMKDRFVPTDTVERFQQSNIPIFSSAPIKASLQIFDNVPGGIETLREKSKKLTGYLEHIINEISNKQDKYKFKVITPENPEERGAQLSILVEGENGKEMFDKLIEQGVTADWRNPNVIRVAPAPLYNSFNDVYRFGKALESAVA